MTDIDIWELLAGVPEDDDSEDDDSEEYLSLYSIGQTGINKADIIRELIWRNKR